MPLVAVPVVAVGIVEMAVEKELELEMPVTTAPQAVLVDRVVATVVA
jgi:hypothetical protein